MKKKIFIGTAIAACLILVACSKKEQHEEQKTESQTTNETPVAKNPASEPLQPLTKVTPEPTQGMSKEEASSIMAEPAAKPVEKVHHKHNDEMQEKVATVEHVDSMESNTQNQPDVKEIPSTTPKVKAEKVASTDTVKPKKPAAHLSEDDAVAAAIAAAQPALKN